MKRRNKMMKALCLMLTVACLACTLQIFAPAQAEAASTCYRVGSEGSKVSEIQQALANKGYFNCSVTGYYGSITTEAVKKFQAANGLAVDGIAGPNTLNALLGSSGGGSSSNGGGSSPSSNSSNCMLGDSSSEVSQIQQRLKDLGYYTYGSITGYFGPITKEAVMDFQSANGLGADGIVGPKTRSALFGSSASASSGSKSVSKSSSSSSSSSSDSSLAAYLKSFEGTPYDYGANGPNSFDCTGFVCYVFKHYFGIALPRTAYDQGYNGPGTKITSINNLQVGDVVYFNTVDDNDLSDHAGIYIGGGSFWHATSGKAHSVVKSDLTSGYYRERFSWARRYL